MEFRKEKASSKKIEQSQRKKARDIRFIFFSFIKQLKIIIHGIILSITVL